MSFVATLSVMTLRGLINAITAVKWADRGLSTNCGEGQAATVEPLKLSERPSSNGAIRTPSRDITPHGL